MKEIRVLKTQLADEAKEVCLIKEELGQAQLKLAQYEAKFDSIVLERLDEKTKSVIQANEDVKAVNEQISSKLAELALQIKKLVPARVKCPKCDGEGTWYDIGTRRDGADWEGPSIRDVCTECNGAGYVENPEREAVRNLG